MVATTLRQPNCKRGLFICYISQMLYTSCVFANFRRQHGIKLCTKYTVARLKSISVTFMIHKCLKFFSFGRGVVSFRERGSAFVFPVKIMKLIFIIFNCMKLYHFFWKLYRVHSGTLMHFFS